MDETLTEGAGMVSGHAFTRPSSADAEGALAARFAAARAVPLPGFLAPALVAQVNALWQSGEFTFERAGKRGKIGLRAVETPPRAAAAIRFVLSRQPLYRWLEEITGCARLSGVLGTVAQMHRGDDEGLTWHDDSSGWSRPLGVTINLGDAAYDGGDFEMRRKGDTVLTCLHHHGTPGEALIFEVSPRFEHRVTPLTAGGPRTIFAGWFLTG